MPKILIYNYCAFLKELLLFELQISAQRRGKVNKHCSLFCISYTGLERVGIFRVGGSANKIKELRQKYNQGEKVDLINDGDVDSVASLLKLFLKELPVAVFPDNICSGLLKTFQGTERAPSKLLSILWLWQIMCSLHFL